MKTKYLCHHGVKGMSWGKRNRDTLLKYGLIQNPQTDAHTGGQTGRELAARGEAGDRKIPDDGRKVDSFDDLWYDSSNYVLKNGLKIYKDETGEAYAKVDGVIFRGLSPEQVVAKYRHKKSKEQKEETFAKKREQNSSKESVEQHASLVGDKIKKADKRGLEKVKSAIESASEDAAISVKRAIEDRVGRNDPAFKKVFRKISRGVEDASRKMKKEIGHGYVGASSNYLYHYGVPGMKWGVWNDETRARRTGLFGGFKKNKKVKSTVNETNEKESRKKIIKKQRKLIKASSMTNEELAEAIVRASNEKTYNDIMESLDSSKKFKQDLARELIKNSSNILIREISTSAVKSVFNPETVDSRVKKKYDDYLVDKKLQKKIDRDKKLGEISGKTLSKGKEIIKNAASSYGNYVSSNWKKAVEEYNKARG